MTSAQDGRAGDQTAAPTDGQPATPSVTTAPAHSPRWWSSVPSHLGRARTSTVIMSVLFLAIGTLYLNVHPKAVGTATTGTGGTVPASTAPARPTTTTRSTAPATTSASATTSSTAPTSSRAPRFTPTPSDTTSAATPSSASPTVQPTAVPSAGTTAAPTT